MVHKYSVVFLSIFGSMFGFMVTLSEAQVVPNLPASVGAMASGGLSATGSFEAKMEPNRIRLVMPIQAEGKDPKAAIMKLADHKKRVKQDIADLKGDVNSLQFEATAITSAISGMENTQVRQVIRPGRDVNADGDDDGEPPRVYTAKSVLTAEWDLPTKDPDALALFPEMLKLQINQKDLQGKKIKAEWTDEEQDRILSYQRRMQQQGMSYYSNPNVASSEVQIAFVAVLEEAKESAALAEAYNIAMSNAKVLAEASKLKLGKIKNVSRSESTEEPSRSYEYDAYGNQVLRKPLKKGPREAISLGSPSISKTYHVHLTFSID